MGDRRIFLKTFRASLFNDTYRISLISAGSILLDNTFNCLEVISVFSSTTLLKWSTVIKHDDNFSNYLRNLVKCSQVLHACRRKVLFSVFNITLINFQLHYPTSLMFIHVKNLILLQAGTGVRMYGLQCQRKMAEGK